MHRRRRLAPGDAEGVRHRRPAGDGLDRGARTAGHPAAAAGHRRRVHRPGDGLRSTPRWARRSPSSRCCRASSPAPTAISSRPLQEAARRAVRSDPRQHEGRLGLKATPDGIVAELARGRGRVAADVRPRARLRRPHPQRQGHRPGEHAGQTSPTAGSSRSTATCGRPIPSILAIGDVAGEPMLAHKATREAKVAVETLLGEPARVRQHGHPGRRLHRPGSRLVRPDRDEAKEQGLEVNVVRFPWAASGRAQSNRPHRRADEDDLRPEDASACSASASSAPGPGRLIAEGVLAVETAAVARDLAESIHAAPDAVGDDHGVRRSGVRAGDACVSPEAEGPRLATHRRCVAPGSRRGTPIPIRPAHTACEETPPSARDTRSRRWSPTRVGACRASTSTRVRSGPRAVPQSGMRRSRRSMAPRRRTRDR